MTNKNKPPDQALERLTRASQLDVEESQEPLGRADPPARHPHL